MVNGTMGSPIAEVIRWRLLLGDGVMQEETLVTSRTSWAAWGTITRWIIAAMVRRTINVHRTQWCMRRVMTAIIENDRWGRASSERTGRIARGADL
jgi:hypothetical protein